MQDRDQHYEWCPAYPKPKESRLIICKWCAQIEERMGVHVDEQMGTST